AMTKPTPLSVNCSDPEATNRRHPLPPQPSSREPHRLPPRNRRPCLPPPSQSKTKCCETNLPIFTFARRPRQSKPEIPRITKNKSHVFVLYGNRRRVQGGNIQG